MRPAETSGAGTAARKQPSPDELRAAAEAVRQACLRAAVDGYEQAGLGGLCEEGRWEMVVDAIRSLDVDAVLRDVVASYAARTRAEHHG